MAVYKITPRFNDTDALGHINHSVILMWMETARREIFKIFNPTLEIKHWNLIVVRVETDYKAQLNYHQEAEVHTTLEKLGNSSFVLRQKIIQDGILGAESLVTMIQFDYAKQKSVPMTEEQRKQLNRYQQTLN